MTQLDQTHPSNPSKEITIDLKELIGLLWGGRKLIILTTSVIAVCTMVYALSLTNYYRSEAIMSLMVTDQQSIGLARIGSIASFAGINLKSEGTKGAMIVNTIIIWMNFIFYKIQNDTIFYYFSNSFISH